jgi:hypothetical protein
MEKVAYLVDPAEALQHRDELTVLPLRDFEVDDVVVQVVFPIARCHRLELAARGVDQDGLKCPDFRGDVNGHTTNYSGQRSLG